MRFVRTRSAASGCSFRRRLRYGTDLPTNKRWKERGCCASRAARGLSSSRKGTIRATAIAPSMGSKQAFCKIGSSARTGPTITQSWPDRGAWVLKLEDLIRHSHKATQRSSRSLKDRDHANAVPMKPATASEVNGLNEMKVAHLAIASDLFGNHDEEAALILSAGRNRAAGELLRRYARGACDRLAYLLIRRGPGRTLVRALERLEQSLAAFGGWRAIAYRARPASKRKASRNFP